MPNALATQLRAIADQLDNGTDASTNGPTLGTGPVLNLDDATYREYIADGKFTRDYWRSGDIGAKAGALYDHYLQAITTASYWHGSLPLHMSILVPPTPKATTWVECLSTPGNLGWIAAGATYRPVPGADNMQRWIDAGCPLANAGGAYDHRGELRNPSEWQAAYDRLRAQQG